MRDDRKIDAWRLADDLAKMVYEMIRKFPREETYGLTGQLRDGSSHINEIAGVIPLHDPPPRTLPGDFPALLAVTSRSGLKSALHKADC
ncbi:MAG TPA: four helix bundle protein [Candidatus Paceibacterota bacterium]|nr:four helix bundle protein [Verrucomicrobiota bacterium]HRY51931.1 four helix bundle protein [Candidatus Paceibacterota bacterium]HRZ99777.1 four helix bundle protein [Candidatus Paceibacterota bacterium]